MTLWTHRWVRTLVTGSVLLAAACGDDDTSEPTPTTTSTATGSTTSTTISAGGMGTGGTGGAGGATGGSAAFDLAAGSWELRNASNRADTLSHDGALAITDAGTSWIAFAEPLPDPDNDQDIFTTRLAGASFEAATALTSDSAVQNAFPSLQADGEQLHLVWNGYPGGDNDIFYASYDGSWAVPADLTSAFEEGTPQDEYRPSLALGPGGALAVVYLASADASTTPPDVRVLRIEGGGAVGQPVTVVPADPAGCEAPRIAFDAQANLHVVVDCGPMGGGAIHYATDASGSWTEVTLFDGANEDNTSPDIAIGPDGTTVHLAWQNWAAAGSGASEIYYARSTGTGFTTPVAATSTPEDTEAAPLIGVDPWGRPLVVYSRGNSANYFDIFVRSSSDGTSFSDESLVTPDTDAIDDWMPYGLAFHPQNGLPQLTFTRILAGTEPLDTEVMHASFVPAR